MPYVDQVEVCVDGVPTVAPSVCQRVTGSVSLSLHNGFNELLQTQSTRTCNYLKESDSDIVSLVHLEHTLSSFTRKQLSGPVQTRGLVGPHHMIGWFSLRQEHRPGVTRVTWSFIQSCTDNKVCLCQCCVVFVIMF